MQASAQAQPNIALVKYWGKRDVAANLPATGSISITLDSLWTRMSVNFGVADDLLIVNGVPADEMLPRVTRCLDSVAGKGRAGARVTSASNFPIAAGLASSASAFAALVVAASDAAGCGHERAELSRLAGRASGSAARSLFDGFVELAITSAGIDVTTLAGPAEWPLQVIVAVTEEAGKAVGSGDAMIRCAQTSPFYQSWVDRQDEDLAAARAAIARRDFAKLGAIAEHNCLKMHSVMWGARPPIVYWTKATLACMETVRGLQDAGHAVFFTIDAGPQVKVVCLPESAEAAQAALASTEGVRKTMQSALGIGARKVTVD
ncbi:MAG: diphosphomevalonate decarboxylase [Gammaproteobacteria bacterium]|nr:diphosphomevalonate decarboxylase [Gammaproteobacteria bacterium]